MDTPAENPSPPVRVRTSFRRTLAFAGMSSVAVFAVYLAWQLGFEALVTRAPERLTRYVEVAKSWDDFLQKGGKLRILIAPIDIVRTGTVSLAFASALATCAVLLGVHFKRWKPSLVGGAAFALLMAPALIFPTASIPIFYVLVALAPGLHGIPLVSALQGAEIDDAGIVESCRKAWPHFRAKNILWLVLSGWILYYLCIMAYVVSLGWIVSMVWDTFGWRSPPLEAGFNYMASWESKGSTWGQIVEPCLLIAGVAFYHFLCASYLLNQLSYLAELGKKPISHRAFWWPFEKRCDISGQAEHGL